MAMALGAFIACVAVCVCPTIRGGGRGGRGAADDAWIDEASVAVSAMGVGAPWPGTDVFWDAGECVLPVEAQRVLADAQRAAYSADVDGFAAMAATVAAVPAGCVLEWPELDAALQRIMVSQAARRVAGDRARLRAGGRDGGVEPEQLQVVSRKLGLGTVYLVVHQYGNVKMARSLSAGMRAAGIPLDDVLLVTAESGLRDAFAAERLQHLFVDAWRLEMWQRKGSDDGLVGTGLCARDDAVALRLVVAREILMRGYSVVNSDVDVVWLRPFPVREYLDVDVAYSLYNGPALASRSLGLKRLWDAASHATRVLWHLEGEPFCGGLWFYASTPRAKRIFHHYFRRAVLDRGETCGDQKAWNTWVARNRHQFRAVRHGNVTLHVGPTRGPDDTADAAVLGMLPVSRFPTAMTWFYGRHGVQPPYEGVVAMHLAEFGSFGKDWGLRELGLWRGDRASWFAGRFMLVDLRVPPDELPRGGGLPFGVPPRAWHANVELQVLRLVLFAAPRLGRIPVLPAFMCAAVPKAGRLAFPAEATPQRCDAGWHYSWRLLEAVHGPSGFRESRFLDNAAAASNVSSAPRAWTMQWLHSLPPGSPLVGLVEPDSVDMNARESDRAWAPLWPLATPGPDARVHGDVETHPDVLVLGVRITESAATSGLPFRLPPGITDDALGIGPATREHGCC